MKQLAKATLTSRNQTLEGLRAALGHEPFGSELRVEPLGPNGVSIPSNLIRQNA
jgi:hypothetical protein